MNIHIDSEELFEDLKERSLVKVEMGSSMYGLKMETSDTDYLYLYFEDFRNLSSLNWLHHQMQYKEDKVDHIFVSVRGFLRSIITGDSTLNFETLFSDEFKEQAEHTNLGFILKYKQELITYSIIKSYLGFAKRDLKALKKGSYMDPKKVSHFLRGVLFAERCLEGKFSLDVPNCIRWVKEGMLGDSEVSKLITESETKMNYLRTLLNKMLNEGSIDYAPRPKVLSALDLDLIHASTWGMDLPQAQLSYEDYYYEAISVGDVKY